MINVGLWCPLPAAPSLKRLGQELRDTAQLQSRLWDILLVTRPLPPAACACRILLADTSRAGDCRRVAAEQAVDFGLSGRASLTLAAMESQRVLCLQRRLYTLSGQSIEPQELPLPPGAGSDDLLTLLAEAGLTLLLGQ